MSRRWLVWLLLAVRPAYAAATPFTLFGISESKGAATLSVPMQIIVLLTLGTLLPAAVMCVTPFLRITIVLHFLRQALGTQTMPSNQVLVGLALFLTIVLMRPVAAEMYHRGWEPVAAGAETPEAGFTEAAKPLRHFLIRFAREKDIRLILGLDRQPAPRTPEDLDLAVLIPAYVLSELKAGFQIGAVLFLPFLMIDLVVASAPFKIMLFVLVDGWNLVVGSLMRSFYG
jgi:flagellar biosynthetic protein FliP